MRMSMNNTANNQNMGATYYLLVESMGFLNFRLIHVIDFLKVLWRRNIEMPLMQSQKCLENLSQYKLGLKQIKDLTC